MTLLLTLLPGGFNREVATVVFQIQLSHLPGRAPELQGIQLGGLNLHMLRGPREELGRTKDNTS